MSVAMDRIYKCPHCDSQWDTDDDTHIKGLEYNTLKDCIEHDGCPDCLSECARCGMLKDPDGFIEHCL